VIYCTIGYGPNGSRSRMIRLLDRLIAMTIREHSGLELAADF
jgi:hypothetical protein